MIYWNSFADFLSMGGYALYVWGSFAVTALIMIGEPWLAVRQQQHSITRLRRQLDAESRRAAPPGNHTA